MAKSLVERYEQLLAQDATSSVFVELAKALLEKGNAARVIEVCEQGLKHHPTSVMARVLWGKALLQLARPAEAMDQFDHAIALDRENPHAYNLISEVLLQRGLFRSALPILRKASALQPNNGRVREWLEQTQQALAGGPQPLLADFTGFGTDAPAQAPSEEAAAPAEEGSEGEAPAPVRTRTPVAVAQVSLAPPADASEQVDAGGDAVEAEPESAATDSASASTEEAPAPVEAAASEPEVLEAPEPVSAPPRAPAVVAQAAPAPVAPAPRGGGLLGDLPPLEDAPAPVKPRAAASASRPASAASGKRSLLEDIPDLAEVAPPPAATPQPKAAEQDAAAIAAAYEKELREKLGGKSAGSALLARHGMRIAVGAVLLVVLGVGVGAFVLRRSASGGQSLNETLERAERLVSQDSHKSLQEALAQLELARDMDDDNARGWALTAYTHALLYADHGASAEDRRQALEALERPGVRTQFQGLGLATDVLVADERGRDTARRALLEAQVESAEVHGLAGSLLLQSKQTEKALERFKRALALSPRQVRALVALGRYYQDFGDDQNALRVYASAHEASPEHPEVRIALAETRLEVDQELKEALADVEPLASATELSPALRERQQLIHGRLLSALGRHEEARGLLARGTKGARGFEFQLALAAASRAAGFMEDAQRAYEEALRLQPRSEEALEGLGRTLLARDREREVLTRLGEGGGRKVALVRGAALARLGDWKRVRTELLRTRVSERYPPEAIVYLALADAAEGNATQAREVLEKALAATKGARGDVRVALGQVYWREKALDKAQAQFEEAQKDPRDHEGACALGRLLISRGLPDLALKPLSLAVERNGAHGEARDALGRALLALGRAEEAVQQFEAWQQDNPGSAAALKGYALALHQAGRVKEAVGASERAVKLAGDDVEAHRTRAATLFATGDAQGAFAELERANKLNPKDAETFCEIAHAFLRQGNADNAAAAFAAARREGPDVPCGRIGEHYVAPEEGGRVAANALRVLAEKSPAAWDRAFAQAARARVLLAAGDVKGAREAADEAVRLAPHAARGQLALGLVALQQKQEAEAKAALLKAVELDAADGPSQLALGDLLARSPADAARAKEAYKAFLRLAGSAPEAARVSKALPALEQRAGR
jgi:tetratricopeptide (TPR) repeat protein